MASILQLYHQDNLLVVVSAMGKTTNHLEKLVDAFYFKKDTLRFIYDEVKQFHFDIIDELFIDKQNDIFNELHNSFIELEWAIEGEPTHSFDYEYDQIVSLGEIFSTKIVSAYLNSIEIKNKWLDARDFIHTNNNYREGAVDWKKTQESVNHSLLPLFESKKEHTLITQGFIGTTSENFTTTLGREGSDYSAAILAFTTDATDVTIWKDVPGVLNADPKWFDDTQLIEQLSYQDAIELSYYGATVIHPKTIKPLQNKAIPLFVKSFISPSEKGTIINDVSSHLPIPSFIFKINQVLISISPNDFSFIAEENLSHLFKLFSKRKIKINLMQNSAISFSICVDNDKKKITSLIKVLQKSYRILYNEGVELITIRHYNQSTIERVSINKNILVEQKSRYTIQLVVKEN